MVTEQDIVGAAIAGKYRVRRIVGGGSMGVVCEAEHLEIGKRVAIKLIDASLAGLSDVALRFRQEARATSLVESHHIVQVFDVGTDERLGLYLVMEYLTGQDLASRLSREKRMPTDAAVRIAVQVGRGLAKAHEAGVVHRDLKPANIFLCTSEDEHPVVKILDFGISKVLATSKVGSAPGLKLTRDGMVVGTPQYMSPEQAQGYSIDERSDVWALGLVLYEMLAGRPAYPELPTYEQFIIHLVSKPPDPLEHVAPWVPRELARVIHGAIEHDLTLRIRSSAELVKRLLEAHPIGGRPIEPSAMETTDTWSDPQSFDSAHPDSSPARLRRRLAELRDAASPTERNDRSVLSESAPVPVPAARASAASASSSGVRGTASDPPRPLEDFRDDAPQFFDRKLLRSLEAPPPSSSGPQPSKDPAAGPPVAVQVAPPIPSERMGAAGWVRWARWGGYALVAIALATAALLALR
jgi:serine/threonine protein kinase